MKLHSLRALGLAVLFTGALSATANADLIAAWDAQNAPSTSVDPTPAPWDWHDNVTVSDMTLHGSVVGSFSGDPMLYAGFSSTINTTDYVGFTVTPNAGFQLTLTDLFYVQQNWGPIAYSWGYRIGGGEWNMFSGQIVHPGEADFKNFAFEQPIVTTQSVEFGFFASAATPTSQVALTINAGGRNDIQLNGTVAAVPEPSTYALMIAGGVVAFVVARRRKLTAGN